jgi:hypothetical protein
MCSCYHCRLVLVVNTAMSCPVVERGACVVVAAVALVQEHSRTIVGRQRKLVETSMMKPASVRGHDDADADDPIPSQHRSESQPSRIHLDRPRQLVGSFDVFSGYLEKPSRRRHIAVAVDSAWSAAVNPMMKS